MRYHNHATVCVPKTMVYEIKKEGHANPPQPFKTTEGHDLGAWCNKQRIAKKKDRLSDDRIQRLDDIGFIWNILEHKWNIWFNYAIF